MATLRRRCRAPAVLAAMLAGAVALGACGEDGESSSADGLQEGSDSASQTEGVEAVPPPADREDPGMGEGPEDAEPGVAEDAGDSTAAEDEEPSEDDLPEPPAPILIPAGTQIDAAPDEDISTAAYRVDDPVIVTVVRDVHGRNGEFLLPQGVRLLGRVRTSMGSGGPGEPPVLEIDFETLSADRYERPIEGAVVNRPVIPDPVADRRRSSASRRVAARTVVPGLIMAGTIIEVELRAPVEVPGFAGLGEPLLPADSLILRGDSAVRRDTMPTPAAR